MSICLVHVTYECLRRCCFDSTCILETAAIIPSATVRRIPNVDKSSKHVHCNPSIFLLFSLNFSAVPHRNQPLPFSRFKASNCCLIFLSSSPCCLCVSSRSLADSLLNSLNSWSSCSCQGYRTKTWKLKAEVPMAKFVSEKPRVNHMLICVTLCTIERKTVLLALSWR